MEDRSRHWNKEIQQGAKSDTLKNWNRAKFQTMVMESGPFWKYDQSPHNTDAYREGWERIFGKKENKDDG